MVYVQSSIVLLSIFSQAQVGAHFRVGNQGTRLNFRAAPAARALSKEINQSTAIALGLSSLGDPTAVVCNDVNDDEDMDVYISLSSSISIYDQSGFL